MTTPNRPTRRPNRRTVTKAAETAKTQEQVQEQVEEAVEEEQVEVETKSAPKAGRQRTRNVAKSKATTDAEEAVEDEVAEEAVEEEQVEVETKSAPRAGRQRVALSKTEASKPTVKLGQKKAAAEKAAEKAAARKPKVSFGSRARTAPAAKRVLEEGMQLHKNEIISLLHSNLIEAEILTNEDFKTTTASILAVVEKTLIEDMLPLYEFTMFGQKFKRRPQAGRFSRPPKADYVTFTRDHVTTKFAQSHLEKTDIIKLLELDGVGKGLTPILCDDAGVPQSDENGYIIDDNFDADELQYIEEVAYRK